MKFISFRENWGKEKRRRRRKKNQRWGNIPAHFKDLKHFQPFQVVTLIIIPFFFVSSPQTLPEGFSPPILLLLLLLPPLLLLLISNVSEDG